MARSNENTRHTKYVVRIVCEGEKTEPLFFTSLCDLYYRDCDDMDVRTIPQPIIPQDEEAGNSSRGNYKGKRRKTKTHEENPIDVVITGTPPLKWVQYARQILSEGVDESWAVYDKDEHPKHEEAFVEANKEIEGKKVNVAFSSRSFEYYLLLHFEYIYYPFDETECGERINGNKHIFECGTGKNLDKDCGGRKCINGYARSKGYWQQTKSSDSTFPIVKDKLIKGIINACRLRAESDANTEEPVYCRNPYTNVDLLVGRLIGKITVCYDTAYNYNEHGSNWSVQLSNDGLRVTNHKEGRELFRKEMFSIYDWENNTGKDLIEKSLLLDNNSTEVIPCELMPNEVIVISTVSNKEVLLLPKFEI